MAAVSHPIEDSHVLEHLPIVKAIAWDVHRRLPVQIDLDDLIQAGSVGLLDALSKFDPAMNVSVSSYAKHRIHGSMMDSLRNFDPISRDMRRFQKKTERAKLDLGNLLQRLPTDEEVAGHLGMTVDGFRKQAVAVASTTISLSTRPSRDDDLPDLDAPCPPSSYPDSILAAKEVAELLKLVGESLPPRYWLVVLLYYWEDKTMKEIGELIGINESRVSQIHDAALNKLSGVLYSMGIVCMRQLVD